MSERHQCPTRVPLVLGFGVDAGNTPPGVIPSRSAAPDTPVPVPTSTTVWACTLAARKVRKRPVAGEAGETPNSRALSRAASTGSGSGIQESANWAKVTVDGEFGDVDDMGDALSSSSR